MFSIDPDTIKRRILTELRDDAAFRRAFVALLEKEIHEVIRK